MGTAIILWVERRRRDGSWERVARRPERQPRGWDPDAGPRRARRAEIESRPVVSDKERLLLRFLGERHDWALGKNHSLIALLADRNNAPPGDENRLEPIRPPRGFPADVSI